MHWYGGSIAEAVTLSKQKNAIFVVFVEGDNDLSQEMATTINSAQVAKRLDDPANFLAVKLKSGSANYTHFAQIYQFVPVPSLFFIGRNGTPLEVVCAGVQPDNLASRIDRILEEHAKDKTSGAAVQPSTSAQNLRQQTADLIHSEASAPASAPQTQASAPQKASAPAKMPRQDQPESSTGPPPKLMKTEFQEITKSGKEYEVVCNDDVCVRRLKVKPDDPGPSSASILAATPMEAEGLEAPTLPVTPAAQPATHPAPVDSLADIEEKMERAKSLIEARKREKAEKEKQLEKQKELERRAIGQGVAELSRWQAEQELKQIQEERKREKQENEVARQRVLAQIAQDRAERRARTIPAPAPPPPQPTGDSSSHARIQFKLPDGTSHTAHFDADGTLNDVHQYVADNLQLSRSNFSLWTAFPRRELTEADATLRRLQLTPSAALLVLPRRMPTTVSAPSTFANIVALVTQIFTSFVLEPSQQLYNWIRARVFPPSEPSARPGGSTGGVSRPGFGAGVRRRGNVHRLGEGRSGDDDNNTWNGNSTQQM